MAAIYPDLVGKVVLVTGGASGVGKRSFVTLRVKSRPSCSSTSKEMKAQGWRKSSPAEEWLHIFGAWT
jgi:hypothetical protein